MAPAIEVTQELVRRMKTANKEWMDAFIAEGGLRVLIDTMRVRHAAR